MQTEFKKYLLLLSGALLLACSPAVNSQQAYTLEQILAHKQTPDGVVIEIVTGDNAGLSWAIPMAQDAIKQIRQRFPELDIAVVTHGREQFALQTSKKDKNPQVHQAIQNLIKNSNVPVHVCGTYAGWRGVSENDFPEYVNVAAAGPAQINDYIALGYLLMVINKKP